MPRRALLTSFLVFQAALLGFELWSRYDYSVNRMALSLTNVASVIGLYFLDRWLRRRGTAVSFLTYATVAMALWLDAIGNFQHLYTNWWWYDHLTHATGGLAATAVFIDVYHGWRRKGGGLSWGMTTWLGFLTGQFLGMVYEMSEYLGDMWFSMQRVGGRYDSPRDLLFNMIGGLVVVGIVIGVRKSRPK